MNRDHALGAADGGVGKERAQIHGHQRRLPVVAVDDVGDPVHVVEGSQRRLGKVAVLGNIAHKVGVGVAPAEKVVVVDEVIDNAIPHVFHDTHIEAAAVRAQVHHELAPVDHLLLVLLRDAGVAGQDDLDVTVLLGEGLGQGVHHVAQTAGLDKGIAFRADKSHAAARLRQVHNRFVHFRFLRSFFFDLRLRFGGSRFRDRRSLRDGGRFLDNGGGLHNVGFLHSRGSLSGGLRLLYVFLACGGLLLRLGGLGAVRLLRGLLRRRLFCGRLLDGRFLRGLGGRGGGFILGGGQLGSRALFGLIGSSLFTRHFYSPLFRIQPQAILPETLYSRYHNGTKMSSARFKFLDEP